MSASEPDFELMCDECPEEKKLSRGCNPPQSFPTFSCLKWRREPEDIVFYGDFAIRRRVRDGKNEVKIFFEKTTLALTETKQVDKVFSDLFSSRKFGVFRDKLKEVYGEAEYKNVLTQIVEKLQEKFPSITMEGTMAREQITIPEARIKINHEREVFIPEASDGYFEQRTGFYVRRGENWIVSELTYLRGTAFKKDKDGNVVEVVQTVRPVLFYNKNGERGYFDPRENSMEFDGKTIFLEGDTEVGGILHTLMSYETAERFLAGETVEIRDVYPTLVERIKKFVNCEWDPRLYDLIACIAIATHFFDVFGAFPITFIYGPPETGKGRVGKCMTYAGHRGISVIDPTDATFYRMIDALRPTLYFDELTMAWEGFQMHWRASYKKGTKVPRMEKVKDERMMLRFFEQFGPTIAASTVIISGREKEATESRFLTIIMKKANDPNPEGRDPEEADFEDILNLIYLCRLTQAKQIDDTSRLLTRAQFQFPSQTRFAGREWELWKPVFTIAVLVGTNVVDNIRSLANEHVGEKRAERYEEEKNVIRGIEAIFKNKHGELISDDMEVAFTPKELSDVMYGLLKEQFGYEESEDERIARQVEIDTKKRFNMKYSFYRLGHMLKRMGLKPRSVPKGKQYNINYKELKDLKARYG